MLAEMARADLLAGHGDDDKVVRLENLADRKLRRLGLNKPAPVPAGPTLQEYLAIKHGKLPVALNNDREPEQKANPQEIAKGPLQIIVSIADQRIRSTTTVH